MVLYMLNVHFSELKKKEEKSPLRPSYIIGLLDAKITY